MRCVVTGAAGFIGHNLARRLLEDGHEVTAVDYTAPEYAERANVWRQCRRVVADLRDPYKTTAALEGAEWVFHMAANVGGVGYLAYKEWDSYFDNMRMSLNVFEAARQWGVERLFFASSSCAFPVELQEYGHTAELQEDVDLETGTPDLMYGREKLMTLRLAEVAPFDARVGLVNSAFGPGLAVSGPRMKFPAAVTVRALECQRTGKPLTVWGDGKQVRSYIYVQDVVDKIMTIMTEPYAGPVSITTSERVTCAQGAQLVLDLLGVDVPIEYVDGETGVQSRNCSNAKWERVYGPDKSRSFAEGMVSLVEWIDKVLGFLSIALITALYGDLDESTDPPAMEGVDDYIAVTDRRRDVSRWRQVIEPRPHISDRLASKIPKCRPHRYTHADVVVWIDASAIVRDDTAQWAASHLGSSDIAQFVHPERDCFADEAKVSIGMKKYAGLMLDEQVAAYEAVGMPRNWGLWATGIMARRQGPVSETFGRYWLDQQVRWSYQDQVSEPYVLWLCGIRPAALDGSLWHDPHINFRGHRSDA